MNGYVMTTSGRLIAQPPWIIADNPGTEAAYDQWLIDQARDEAAELGEDWMICRLAGLDASFMDCALRHLLSDFLFGQPDPEFEARDRTTYSTRE
jgi:hypothetical protein